MVEPCGMHGKYNKFMNTFIRKLEGKRPLGGSRQSQEENTEWILKKHDVSIVSTGKPL
jgi:hypothetical protein